MNAHERHNKQLRERESIIADARKLDPATMDAETCAAGPGKFEGANDLELTVAIYVISLHGFQDAQAGTVELGQNLQRVGQYVIAEDDRGFVTLFACENENAAQKLLDIEDELQNGESE